MPTLHRSMIVVAAVAFAAAVPPARAHAQGTNGAFPDPISSREFERAMTQLGLDEASRRTIEPMHEAYRQSMRELRDGPIEEYLRQRPGGSGFFAPQRPRAEVEQAIRRREQILDQIARTERELFDHVQATLSPEQVPLMQRVRSAAARERARGVFGQFGASGLQVEVGALVDELELSPAERQAIAAPIDEHERKLTKLLGELAELSIQQPLAMADAVAAAGIRRPESLEAAPGSTPEQAAEGVARTEEWFRQIGKVRRDVTAPQRAKREAIARLNRDTVTSLVAALPPSQGSKLFDRFVQKAYWQIGAGGAAAQTLEKAVKVAADGGDASVADAVKAIAADFRVRDAKIVGEMMDEVDSSRQGFEMFMGDDEGAFERQRQRMEDLRARRAEIATAAIEQAKGALGPAMAARLGGEGPARKGERMVVGGGGAGGDHVGEATFVFEAVATDGAEIVVDDGAVMVAMGGDAGDFDVGDFVAVGGEAIGGPGGGAVGPLPAPITAVEMRQLAERLGAPEEQRPVLEALHEDYSATFGAARDEERAELGPTSGPFGLRPAGAGGDAAPPRPPTDGDIDKRYSAFRRGVDRLSQVDAGLFENLGVVLGGTPAESRIAAAKSARDRNVLLKAARGPGGGMPIFTLGGGGADGGKQAELDLAAILDGCGLTPDAVAAATPALNRWAEQATAMARQRFETLLAAKQEVDKFHAKAMQVTDDGRADVRIDSNDGGFEAMQKAQQRIEQANRQVADFNRSARDEIMNALPPDAREPFRRAFNRAAFPSLYRDKQSATAKLDAAIGLADLADAQRPQVAALMAEHAAAYEALCDRMVAVELSSGARPANGVFDGDAMRAMQTRQNDLKKLRFDRTELNASTLKKLGAILTPEQVEKIGGVALPEAKQRGGIQFGM